MSFSEALPLSAPCSLLFDDHVRLKQHGLWNGQADLLGEIEIVKCRFKLISKESIKFRFIVVPLNPKFAIRNYLMTRSARASTFGGIGRPVTIDNNKAMD
jgi:hypothetical protein